MATPKLSYIAIMVFIVAAICMGLYILKEITMTTKTEGFQDRGINGDRPTISFCPKFAPEIQTARGSTDCCEGELVDGKCKGKTFCTQSPTHDGITSCIDAWRGYFEKKSRDMCPQRMPYYYEDVKQVSGAKGCSQTVVDQTGVNPTNTGAPKCRIYDDANSNQTRGDSCYYEKKREKLQCPYVPSTHINAKIKSDGNNQFQYLYCEYTNWAGGLPEFCGDDKTFQAYNDRTSPNWRTGSTAESTMDTFCSRYLDARSKREAAARKLKEEKEKRVRAEKDASDERQKRNRAERNWRAALKRQHQLQKNCKA